MLLSIIQCYDQFHEEGECITEYAFTREYRHRHAVKRLASDQPVVASGERQKFVSRQRLRSMASDPLITGCVNYNCAVDRTP